MTKQYWMFSRPQRKLYRLPQTVAALYEVAHREEWGGARELHVAFEEVLERELIKRPGERRDGSGSGGRTHAALVRSLGFAFVRERTNSLELTLAGQALAEGAPPRELIRHQVLRFQFPSPYSVGRNVDISPRFKVRPFILILRMLLLGELGGLTQEEIALRVLVHGTGDAPKDATRVAKLVLDYRARGIDALEPDFVSRFGGQRDTFDSLRSKLNDIANTALNWLEYSDVIERNRDVVSIPESLVGAASALIDVYTRENPIRDSDQEETFQRRYGLPPGVRKDTRDLARSRALTELEHARRRVNTVVMGWARSELLVEGATPEIIDRLVEATGLERAMVARVAQQVLGRDRTVDQFLSTYANLVHDESPRAAKLFEESTANILKAVFRVDAKLVGSQGREPDVVVSGDGWRGIVDTKAYSGEYTLPSGHDRAMREYVENYRAGDSPLRFWAFICGAVARGASAKVHFLGKQVGLAGTVVGMVAWLQMIKLAEAGVIGGSDLPRLFSIGRELTLEDLPTLVAGG
ncbi:restriction endonuclease FokI C-terminal domain-containing protein [Microbacterium hydrocarbonoxydans]|uniref:restriction endonuclease FokI C-terminal domain-containing protein n=1 Tax=Microbacterium hydrocarbonoxydans TaxID=273678 RepID=UPI0013D9B48A|nr:restriction endonuclease FokI C-terminal domain-containing protein [Microbacterium hydrocarbonoxydans]